MVLAAKKAYPNECCGILVGKKSEQSEIEVTEIREAENQFQGQKAVHFKIDPLYLYHLEQELDPRGLEIVGIYHSHPDTIRTPTAPPFSPKKTKNTWSPASNTSSCPYKTAKSWM